MQSYYDILGLPINAGNNEIKAAFRRLAKLYHPDKNPQGKEHFERILVAYEVLIDPMRRRQYDSKLKYGKASANASMQKTQKKKEWNFGEDEMKRRQYYKENYRKEYQKAQAKAHFYPEKKIYNEFKYVLFAAPLAVALLMFIINSIEPDITDKKIETAEIGKEAELKMGDNPYSGYFKNPVYDIEANKTITLKNLSGNDGVVCLFGKKDRFLRCCFLKEGFQVELSQLPNENVTVKMTFGKKWNRSKEFKDADAIGGFENQLGYYIMKNDLKDLAYPITIDKTTLQGLKPSNEKEFFGKN